MASHVLLLHPSGAETASGQSAGQKIGKVEDLVAFFNVTAITAGSIAFDIEDSPDGTTWYPFTTLPGTVTAPGVHRLEIGDEAGPYIRVKWTIVTGPATFSAEIACNPRP